MIKKTIDDVREQDRRDPGPPGVQLAAALGPGRRVRRRHARAVRPVRRRPCARSPRPRRGSSSTSSATSRPSWPSATCCCRNTPGRGGRTWRWSTSRRAARCGSAATQPSPADPGGRVQVGRRRQQGPGRAGGRSTWADLNGLGGGADGTAARAGPRRPVRGGLRAVPVRGRPPVHRPDPAGRRGRRARTTWPGGRSTGSSRCSSRSEDVRASSRAKFQAELDGHRRDVPANWRPRRPTRRTPARLRKLKIPDEVELSLLGGQDAGGHEAPGEANNEFAGTLSDLKETVRFHARGENYYTPDKLITLVPRRC